MIRLPMVAGFCFVQGGNLGDLIGSYEAGKACADGKYGVDRGLAAETGAYGLDKRGLRVGIVVFVYIGVWCFWN